jgi:hypothetical protein
MPIAQTIEAPETERGDQVGPEFPSMPKHNIADFPVGTRFKVNFASYVKKHMEVISARDGYIDMIDINERGGRHTMYCLNRTNIEFYAQRNLIEITKFVAF